MTDAEETRVAATAARFLRESQTSQRACPARSRSDWPAP